MIIDVFERHLHGAMKVTVVRGPSGIVFKLTSDHQYDTSGRRLCNIALPKHNHDPVTLTSIQSMKNEVDENCESLRIL